jgi:hypothetical protein
MEYGIVQADTSVELERMVTAMIEEGWRPQGGVCCVRRDAFSSGNARVLPSPPAFRYVQAMVRRPGPGDAMEVGDDSTG